MHGRFREPNQKISMYHLPTGALLFCEHAVTKDGVIEFPAARTLTLTVSREASGQFSILLRKLSLDVGSPTRLRVDSSHVIAGDVSDLDLLVQMRAALAGIDLPPAEIPAAQGAQAGLPREPI